MKKTKRLSILFLIFLIIGIMGYGGCDNPPSDVMLECEVEGYPCSLAEVPMEILERSDALGDEVLVMFERGDSTAEAKAWLNEQAGMAEVESDDLAVRFRLDGGRGTWILRKEAFATRSVPGAASSAHRPALQSAVVPLYVVGEGSEQKKALVLSPMQWDFDENDDGAQVAEILAGTRGYENGVTYLANDSVTSSVVNVNSFKGWQDYQVIHVDSHGTQICGEDSPCRAVIFAITLEAVIEGPVITPEEAATLTETGVVFVKSEERDSLDLALEADFFQKQYPNGLDDTLIFINACETFGKEATDLADAIRGNTSVFLGWDESVYVDDAAAASQKLYQELSEWGYTIETAYSNLGDLQFDEDGAQLILGKRKAGGDLRIRDVVYLLNPVSGQILSPSDKVAIVGTQGDGEPDAAPYLVQVDGVKKELASGVLVHVSVDGVVGEPQPLSNGEVNDHDQWLVSGVVNLPFDLKEDELVTFEAWVELPSGGESNHEIPATLTGEEEPIVGEWVVDNDSLDVRQITFELDYVSGEIRGTFRSDGTVEVVYDDWEYRVSDSDDLSVGGIDIERYEEFTYTTNAQGTTTYEVEGDSINFGHSFSSDFLEGTETVHHIRRYNPPNMIGPDIDEETERPANGRNVFVGSPNYELGSTLRLIFWNREVILHRVGSADE